MKNYTLTLTTTKSSEEVFTAINKVSRWWSEDFKGKSAKQNDVFEVTFFGDVHYSKHKLIEVIPNKRIVWEVLDSKLNFLENENEWAGTKNVFEIFQEGNKTKIKFTHEGLVPTIECYNDCYNGWNYYLKESLLPFIETGVGQPTAVGAKLEA